MPLSHDIAALLAATPPWRHLAHRARVLILLPDATRPLPLAESLSPLLDALRLEHAQVEVLIALGLHRPMSHEELAPLHTLCDAYQVPIHQHDALDPLANRASAPPLPLFEREPERGDLPVSLDTRLFQADLILALGVVEPHQYAGFSGGEKILSIGCAGAETISALHGLPYLRHPLTTLGMRAGNPFRDAIDRVAATLDTPRYALQLVPDPHDPARHTPFFGPIREAFEQACSLAQRTLFTTHRGEPLPWVHLKVDGPKGVNFYQASRAATYVALVDRPIVARGGWILLEAPCPEGMGEGAGERACALTLQRGGERLRAELAGTVAPPDGASLSGGAQRAYVIARALEQANLALISPAPLPELDVLGIPRFAHLREAIEALGLDDQAGVSLEDVFHQVPRLAI